MLRGSGDVQALKVDFGRSALTGGHRYTITPGIPGAIRVHSPEWFEKLTEQFPEHEYITVTKDHNYSRVESAKGQMQQYESAYGKACASVKKWEETLASRREQQERAEKLGGSYNEGYVRQCEIELEAAIEERDIAQRRFNEAAEEYESGALVYIPIPRKAIEDLAIYELEHVPEALSMPLLPARRI